MGNGAMMSLSRCIVRVSNAAFRDLTYLASTVAMLAIFAAASAAPAQTPVDFYRGKTVSLLVGFGPDRKSVV